MRWRIVEYQGSPVPCTTKDCPRSATWVFQGGDVWSYHCDPCAEGIRRLLERSSSMDDPVPFP